MKAFTSMLIGLAAALAPTGPAFADLAVERLGTYASGVFDRSAAEIVAHDAENQRLLIVNAADRAIDVIDFSDPAAMTKSAAWPIAPHGAAANSVAVHGRLVAVAVEAEDKQAPGKIVLFSLDGETVAAVEAGALPDMVAFSGDGKYVVAANEGEPSDDYKTDPEGSITILNVADKTTRTVRFDGLDRAAFGASAHFPSPAGTSLAQDLEPEYVAVGPDNRTAFVVFQENNAIALIDLETASVTRVFGLGLRDWRNLAFDASDKDQKINRRPWPVLSMPQPDAIAAFEQDGVLYVVTANEGDARDYAGYSEETRVAELTLDPTAYPDADALQAETALGRLKTTTAKGDADGDGDIDQIHAFGGRSFSIYNAAGALVFDSGDQFSDVLTQAFPTWFNSEGQESNFDARSDDKGVEPEGVALGDVDGRRYAFIGLERMGGVMIYDITDPAAPAFETYIHNGVPTGDPEAGEAGDVGPEGLLFIPAERSPTDGALLVVANEVSGTTTAFALK